MSGALKLEPSVVRICQACEGGLDDSTLNTCLQTEQRTVMPSPTCRSSNPNSVPQFSQRTIIASPFARSRFVGNRPSAPTTLTATRQVFYADRRDARSRKQPDQRAAHDGHGDRQQHRAKHLHWLGGL